MKFTVASLLDQLPSDDALPLSKLEKGLGLSLKTEKQHLAVAVAALEQLGLVSRSEAGLQRADQSELIPARLRCSSKGFCFALRDDGGDDIYIRDHQLNHAWNGDRVLVRVTRDGGRRRSPEGMVSCILERQTPSLLAQVEQQEDGRLVATPLDDRLLTSVELPAADASYVDPEQASVVDVVVDRYPVAQFLPQGHVNRRLPVNGGEAADLDLLLTKHRLHDRPAAPRGSLQAVDLKERQDLTGQASLLLQPWRGKEAPGLPALALESRPGGGTTLWLHAPAVAERLLPGSGLDLWLRDRGDALCVGRQWLPLLSSALSKAAAFTPGEVQAAVSLALELDGQGAVEHYRLCLSQIRPVAVVDGEALTALAARKPKSRTLAAPLKPLKDQLEQLEQLLACCAALRQHRLAAGSLELNLTLPAIDSLGDLASPDPSCPQDGWLVSLADNHPTALLREVVLAAERAMGEHLAVLGLPALFASNPAADPADLNDVARAALALEIPMALGEEGNASAAELAAAFAATDRSRPLQQQLRAVLKPVELGELPGPWALGGQEGSQPVAPWCCATLHYSDLWNQQLLVLLLREGKDRPSPRHKVAVDLASDSCHGAIDWPLLSEAQLAGFRQALEQGLVQRLNGRRRFQAELHTDLLAMAQARQAEPLVGQVLPGVISGVQSYGFFVEVPPSMVEGLVHVSSLKDDWYEYRSRQNRLVGRKNRRTYMLGDAVEVEIQKVDALRHQIDLAVMLPEGYEAEAAENLDEPA